MLNLHSVNNQKGIVHYLIILLVVLGIGVAVFLSQKPQIFSPKAQQYSDNQVKIVEGQNDQNVGVRYGSPAYSYQKLLMVNYKFTNPGDTNVARARVAVSDLKAKEGILSAYYGITPNLHYTGQLVNLYPAKSPYDPNWNWAVDPNSVTASEVTDPSCYQSPNNVENRFSSDGEKLLRGYETGWMQPEMNYKICFQSSNIDSIEGVSPLKPQGGGCAEILTHACLNPDKQICLDFLSTCLPDGWTEQKKVISPSPSDRPGNCMLPEGCDDSAARKRDAQRIQDLKKIHDALLIYKKDHNSFCLKGNGNCKGNTDPFVQYIGTPARGLEKYADKFSVEALLSRYIYPIPNDPLYNSKEVVELGKDDISREVPWPNYMVVMYDDKSFVLSARLEVLKPENKHCVPQDAPLVNYCINQE